MRAYNEVRQFMQTGDVLLCKKRNPVSILIRIFTAESFNHVAVLLRNAYGRVEVAEMRGGIGYQQMPMSQWLLQNKGTEIFWGQAPDTVDRYLAYKVILMTRAVNPRYSYWTLVSVWLSQVFQVKTKSANICSTFAAKVWTDSGYGKFLRTPDPGDFAAYVKQLTGVTHA